MYVVLDILDIDPDEVEEYIPKLVEEARESGAYLRIEVRRTVEFSA